MDSSHELPSRPAASLIIHHHDEILRDWVDTVMTQTDLSTDISRGEIANHLLALLEHIVHLLSLLPETVQLQQVTSHFEPIAKLSARHGRERASFKDFTADQLLNEYHLLRYVIADTFRRHEPDDTRSMAIIERIIDVAAISSVREFLRVSQGVQSQFINTALQDLEKVMNSMKADAGNGLLMRFEKADLNAAMEVVCREASQLYEHEVSCQLEDHPVTGVFDMPLIVRCAENLIANAVKFGDEHKPISVSVKDQPDFASVTVLNQGEPIAADQRERIFRFFSEPLTGQRHHGFRQGLSLVKAITEKHGGGATVNSSKESGTCFELRFRKDFRHENEELVVMIQ